MNASNLQLGVIGLGTMGANIARNAARNGALVPVFNRTTEKTEAFMKTYGSEGNFVACTTYEELIAALRPPRVILIMVKAGAPVDDVIDDLLPLLASGDILIDGGNSHFPDTDRRFAALAKQGIEFVGMGVSGGEEGALNGPSMMPGGSKKGYETLQPLLVKMAADDGAGGTCVACIGQGGSGHFVKMVHNGIEYAVMQLIAESYDVLKTLGSFTNEQLAEIYGKWNESDFLGSFLMEITAQIFRKTDDLGSGKHLVDLIVDGAEQKGTGKWTTQAALDFGVTVPSITAAVDARIISGDKQARSNSRQFMPEALDETLEVLSPDDLTGAVALALEQSIMLAYEQGFSLMKRASDEAGWSLDLSETARIWRGGCIIRSKLLPKYQAAYGTDKKAAETAGAFVMSRFGGDNQRAWRRVIALAVARGIPVPAMSSALSYYDSYRRERLPQSLIQAQRDFFGAHTFKRTDRDGVFHAEWDR